MSGRTWIYTGLGVVIALVLFPAWHGALNSDAAMAPELEYPDGECIESAEYMRAYHPAMLNEWRDDVVRDGDVEFVSSSGEHFTKSLTGTCMECHQNRETFCVRCHEYADVDPTCWSCHVEP